MRENLNKISIHEFPFGKGTPVPITDLLLVSFFQALMNPWQLLEKN